MTLTSNHYHKSSHAIHMGFLRLIPIDYTDRFGGTKSYECDALPTELRRQIYINQYTS